MGMVWALAGALLVTGCAGGPPTVETRWEFEAESPGARAMEAWLRGQEVPPAEVAGQGGVEALLVAGEMALWEGDREAAFELFGAQLAGHPGEALNRYAALRLSELVGQVVEGPQRLAALLAEVRYDREHPLTRVALTELAWEVARDRWERSQVAEPFVFEGAGVPTHFRVSPLMSPWRLLDAPTPFAPERSAWLADQYRSPEIARPSPANWQPTQVLELERPDQALRLGSGGVYYLEAALQVAGDKAQEVTLYGDFQGAARVWVGDSEVLAFEEQDYESGRMMRRLRLEPGTHRVLMKVAYAGGYRDRFELRVVPSRGPVLGPGPVHFVAAANPDQTRAKAEVRSPTQSIWELEPAAGVLSAPATASASALWWAANSALQAGQVPAFEAAMEALRGRLDGELSWAAELLWARQARTRWDVPGQLRDAEALMRTRAAYQRAPESPGVLSALAERLRQGGSESERRGLLEAARDAAVVGERLRDIEALKAWASFLAAQGVRPAAEQAWKEVLKWAPADCTAASRLQSLYAGRSYVPHPRELTESWERCPQLEEVWLDARGPSPQAVAFAARQAARQPYRISAQLDHADALRGAGQAEAALAAVRQARARMPSVASLWLKEAELLVGAGQPEQALQTLEQAQARYGHSARVDERIASLQGRLPLAGAMPDGLKAARAEIARAGGEPGAELALDEAYYVLDYAARRYFEDGSSWTLTHTVVRLMTRGAIDRYAEVELPRGAQPVLVRTIKASGAVRVPEEVAGKDTLSMPGLEPGDMIEVAYLQFAGPGAVRSHVEGMRFFFRMGDVSTRHSEYVVLGDEGLNFIRANGAPRAEPVEIDGVRGVRFVATDQRRPTPEPLPVTSEEVFPWVQEYRVGVEGGAIEADRRYVADALLASRRVGPALRARTAEWLGRPVGHGELSDPEVRRLFYAVSEHFAQPSPLALTTDANHALLLGRGSPLVVLQAVYELVGVEAQMYLARAREQPEARHPVGDFGRYGRPLLRVVLPESGEEAWLEAAGPDAMWGAVDGDVQGQGALCVSCPSYQETTVQGDRARRPTREVDVEGRVDEEGTLHARARYTFGGMRAVRVRSALRARQDEQDRARYIDQVVQELIKGARVAGFEVLNAGEVDAPLVFEAELVREGFARQVDQRHQIDTTLFTEELAGIYASLASRELPLRVGYEREQSYALRLQLPPGAEPELFATDLALETPFGSYSRNTRLEDGELRLDAAVNLPRQRVMPPEYPAFRNFATRVEQSAGLVVRY
ncbi:hypothetical protein DL240_18000 [Lujinxingia litoralis]|uniref:DUF3857 domain-containing protein n=2 Tax=Lujinxingia litoralis TaxID=2211119 RepID=A0A328C4N6_9DELT|nr:hypothetical protein DL240_18000 [Lujinxingia litoralis]